MGRLNEEFPTFDDDWVASAQNREPSAAELEARELADWKRQRRAWRRHVVRRTFGTIVLLGLVVGFAWFVVSANRQTAEPVALDLGGGVQHAFIFEEPTLQPTNGRRLLPEVTPANPSASHAFVSTNDDGTTVRYDPCRPVRFVVNADHAPPDHLQIITDSLATASAASGLQLELVGDTAERPTNARPLYQPDRYGAEHWAPVLIAWTDETVIAELAGNVAGVGGSSWVGAPGRNSWYVSGTLYLDRELGADAEPNRIVMIHELGHVLGLDHVSEPDHVMYPASTVSALGEGDLAGFAAIGAGDCASDL